MLSEQEILRYIGRQPKHTAGFKQMLHDLALKGRERRDLESLLKGMTRRRKLVAIGKERWGLPTSASSQNLVTGLLRLHRDGYGFVTPDAGSLPERARGKLAGDIFVPPSEIGSAMHGDSVLVELGALKPDGRAEGRIVRVTDRRQETIVGTFHYGGRHNFVRPLDPSIATEIVIPPGMEHPPAAEDLAAGESEEGKKAEAGPHQGQKHGRSTPHRVVGQEAKPVEWDELENLVVEVEIIQWPSATQGPRGRVIEIIGREDDFGVDVEIIIRKHHIPHTFPADVLQEAQEIDPAIGPKETEHRQDYRGLPIVTIDGETARDFDDAVLVRRLENGNYELHVHIADVAHYVEDGSPIDREARERGTSVYFPDRAVPMLPLELSTDICSLRPEVERLVLSCVMELDPRGEVIRYELNEGVIRSAQRMTYTGVNAILEGDQTMRNRYASLVKGFELMHELAQILNRKRTKRGSIDFDLPEAVIEFDELGLMQGVTRSERNWAHRLIEEFMLAANETVAGHLEQRGVGSLYRIHEKPDPKKIFEFETLAATFGHSLGIGALPVKRMQMRADKRSRQGAGRSAPLIELPEEVHITPRMYQKLVQKIAGTPEERILSYLMLRSLKQARYSEKNEGHFALAAASYTHFTSPIRRYPDLIVHRILKAVLREGDAYAGASLRPAADAAPWSKRRAKSEMREGRTQESLVVRGPLSEDELHDIAETSSRTERAAAEAERELLEWKKMKFMQDRVGEEFDGLIISVTKYGFFVELESLFIEGLVPLASLDDDHYAFHENTRQIIGGRSRKTYSIGQKIRVLVDRIDRMARKVQFAVVLERETKNSPRRRGGT
ncbi:MAG TPA: RNB domain-containing ribonuclease [Candidatus Saccharimonadales bacterium]|jgi:ribonuclease R|nr:RNB domain-containing ribonuclease [Candidatus Saccharimonadales bacterium]